MQTQAEYPSTPDERRAALLARYAKQAEEEETFRLEAAAIGISVGELAIAKGRAEAKGLTVQQAIAQIEEEREHRFWEMLLVRARLDAFYRDGAMQLDDFKPERLQKRIAAKNIAVRYLRSETTPWLFFAGPNGTGKTHLAVGIALDLLWKWGGRVEFWRASEIVQKVFDAMDGPGAMSPGKVMDHYRTVGLLVVDEFGKESHREAVLERLEDILNHRYERRAPTILTSNKTVDEIAGFSPSLASRLLDKSVVTVVDMAGLPDYRRQKTPGRTLNPTE